MQQLAGRVAAEAAQAAAEVAAMPAGGQGAEAFAAAIAERALLVQAHAGDDGDTGAALRGLAPRLDGEMPNALLGGLLT